MSSFEGLHSYYTDTAHLRYCLFTEVELLEIKTGTVLAKALQIQLLYFEFAAAYNLHRITPDMLVREPASSSSPRHAYSRTCTVNTQIPHTCGNIRSQGPINPRGESWGCVGI
ncbi:hypothetical protein L6452_17599 [Arctium lappa]|uniref:Uncharacterized protein n=1 Tax=Arctium lappa TaxID=4217 RepID=A0ACB9C3U4_ARCLA|nr:hypothetical protein L6452_17599 [Arctium lappa]